MCLLPAAKRFSELLPQTEFEFSRFSPANPDPPCLRRRFLFPAAFDY